MSAMSEVTRHTKPQDTALPFTRPLDRRRKDRKAAAHECTGGLVCGICGADELEPYDHRPERKAAIAELARLREVACCAEVAT